MCQVWGRYPAFTEHLFWGHTGLTLHKYCLASSSQQPWEVRAASGPILQRRKVGVTDAKHSSQPHPLREAAEAVLQAWTIPQDCTLPNPHGNTKWQALCSPLHGAAAKQLHPDLTAKNCQGRDKHKLREEISFLRRSKVGVKTLLLGQEPLKTRYSVGLSMPHPWGT